MASGSDGDVDKLHEQGFFEDIAKYLGELETKPDGSEVFHNQYSNEITEQASWALGNISGTSNEYRDMINGFNVIRRLGELLKRSAPNSRYTHNVMWCLTNCIRGKGHDPSSQVLPVIPVIIQVAQQSTKVNLLIDASWALSYITDLGDEYLAKIAEHGGIQVIISLLNHSENKVVLPSVRSIGNISTGSENISRVIFDCGALPKLAELLSIEDKGILKETCWLFSNLLAESVTQVLKVMESGALGKLIKLCFEEDLSIRKEAAWCISNAAALVEKPIIEYIVNNKGLDAMNSILSEIEETKILLVALEGIKNILAGGKKYFLNNEGDNPYTLLVEQNGLLDKIEGLQHHSNNHIYEVASSILENYFTVE